MIGRWQLRSIGMSDGDSLESSRTRTSGSGAVMSWHRLPPYQCQQQVRLADGNRAFKTRRTLSRRKSCELQLYKTNRRITTVVKGKTPLKHANSQTQPPWKIDVQDHVSRYLVVSPFHFIPSHFFPSFLFANIIWSIVLYFTNQLIQGSLPENNYCKLLL